MVAPPCRHTWDGRRALTRAHSARRCSVRAACVTERDRKGRAAKTNELCVRAPLGSLVTDENIFPFLNYQILEAIAACACASSTNLR